ncbi:MAG: hypothetical protein ACOCZK_02350 [Planctomycetota bacterium]
MAPSVHVSVDDRVTVDELYAFYMANNCCETRYPPSRVAAVLRKSDLVISARHDHRLIGIVRVVTDGIAAAIMEFSLSLQWQGPGNKDGTGALIEDDRHGIAGRMGVLLLSTLESRGIDRVDTSVYGISDTADEVEIPFYRKVGFHIHQQHTSMYWDRRPPRSEVGGGAKRDFLPTPNLQSPPG